MAPAAGTGATPLRPPCSCSCPGLARREALMGSSHLAKLQSARQGSANSGTSFPD